jgi:hypothetical protein
MKESMEPRQMQNCSEEQAAARLTFVPWAAPNRAAPWGGARRMTPEQGHALETLAHAIEYLEYEAVLSGDFLRNAKHPPELEAVARLKAASRNLWASLPAREPLWRRLFQSADHGTATASPII